jgi:hypothetical protein
MNLLLILRTFVGQTDNSPVCHEVRPYIPSSCLVTNKLNKISSSLFKKKKKKIQPQVLALALLRDELKR